MGVEVSVGMSVFVEKKENEFKRVILVGFAES
jgi:hypothetical protein